MCFCKSCDDRSVVEGSRLRKIWMIWMLMGKHEQGVIERVAVAFMINSS